MQLLLDLLPEVLLAMGFLVCIGLLYGWKMSMSPVLEAMASAADAVDIHLPFHRIHPLRFMAKVIRAGDASVQHWLGQGVLATEAGMVALWQAMAGTGNAQAKLLADLANSLEHVLTHLLTVTIPRIRLQAERYALSHINAVRAQLTAAQRALDHRLTRGIDRVRDQTALELARLTRGIDRVSKDLTHTIAQEQARARARETEIGQGINGLARGIDRTNSRVGSLEGRLSGVLGRLSGVEKLLGVSAITGAVALALTRLGLSWTKCDQVGKVGRNVCGMDPSLLESLLIDLTALAGTMSLVEFAKEMQGVVSETERGIRKFWQAD